MGLLRFAKKQVPITRRWGHGFTYLTRLQILRLLPAEKDAMVLKKVPKTGHDISALAFGAMRFRSEESAKQKVNMYVY